MHRIAGEELPGDPGGLNIKILLQFTPPCCQLPKTMYFVSIDSGRELLAKPTMVRHHRGAVQLTAIVPLAKTVARPLVGSDASDRFEPSWGTVTANCVPLSGKIETRVCGKAGNRSVRVQSPAICAAPQRWDGGSGGATSEDAVPTAACSSTATIPSARAVTIGAGCLPEKWRALVRRPVAPQELSAAAPGASKFWKLSSTESGDAICVPQGVLVLVGSYPVRYSYSRTPVHVRENALRSLCDP